MNQYKLTHYHYGEYIFAVSYGNFIEPLKTVDKASWIRSNGNQSTYSLLNHNEIFVMCVDCLIWRGLSPITILFKELI